MVLAHPLGAVADGAGGGHSIGPFTFCRGTPAAYGRARSQGLWRFPGSFSPTRTLHNYMTDPSLHPQMERDTQDFMRRNPRP
jgi:hypothetical protein